MNKSQISQLSAKMAQLKSQLSALPPDQIIPAPAFPPGHPKFVRREAKDAPVLSTRKPPKGEATKVSKSAKPKTLEALATSGRGHIEESQVSSRSDYNYGTYGDGYSLFNQTYPMVTHPTGVWFSEAPPVITSTPKPPSPRIAPFHAVSQVSDKAIQVEPDSKVALPSGVYQLESHYREYIEERVDNPNVASFIEHLLALLKYYEAPALSENDLE